ncbi:MAG: hypothetical protein AAGN46_15875 [Acidobacteriota bacterium]
MAAPFEGSEDLDYFRALERHFIARRGAPLQLSPDDFRIARGWRADGVPLDVAIEAIDETIDARETREDDPARRLAYYNRPVRAAWRRRAELAAPAAAAPKPAAFDPTAALDRLQAAVPAAHAGLAAEVAALKQDSVDDEALESRLAAIDRRLLEAAAVRLDDAARAAIDDRLDAVIRRLRGRVEAEQLERTRARLLDDAVRRHFDLPLLSLFSPDARPISD